MIRADMDMFRELMESFKLDSDPDICIEGHVITIYYDAERNIEVNFYFTDEGKFDHMELL